jgi:hypothetical protein
MTLHKISVLTSEVHNTLSASWGSNFGLVVAVVAAAAVQTNSHWLFSSTSK